jgi:hypothetical protein
LSATLKIRIDLARLTEYDENGFLGFQYDAFGEQASGVPAVEALSPYGFIGRPLDPVVSDDGEVTYGADLLTFFEGFEGRAMALHDARLVPGLPRLQKGESLVYGPAFNFCRFHADGRITRFTTTDGTADGKSVYDQAGPEGFLEVTPWHSFRRDALGLHYRHTSGASLDMGAISGLPAPFDALGTYYTVRVALARIEAASVQLGVGAGVPVAKAPETLVLATSIVTAAQSLAAAQMAIAGALTALGAVPLNAPALPNITAAAAASGVATAAVVAAAAALGVAQVAVPSLSTTVT